MRNPSILVVQTVSVEGRRSSPKVSIERTMATFIPHNVMPPMTEAVRVQYCTQCGLPEDYCKYGPMADKHAPAAASSTVPIAESQPSESSAAPVEEPKKEEVKEKSKQFVTVKIAPRQGRRFLSTICGLEQFGVDLAKAQKIFAKKYASGVGKVGEGDLEIQGAVEETILDVLTSNWKTIGKRQVVIKRK
jgi:density-regulated protein DRP1